MPFDAQAEQDALTLLSALVRLDTTNPPGNERACAELLAAQLRAAGLEPQLLEKAPGRSNLVARIKGDGSAGGPLLLLAQLDVPGTRAESWKHPPFAAEVADGWLYGRGAVDAKSFSAAAALVVRELAREGARLKRDLIFAAVADAEGGNALGARFLVEQHPDLVRADWAIGGAGGVTVPHGDRRVYPIPVAHKGACSISMKARGLEGQASLPRHDSAVLKLARALSRIGNMALPVHVCEPTRRMLRELGRVEGRLRCAMLARASLADFALESLVEDLEQRRLFNPLLRNTAVPVALRGGEAADAIPGEAEARLVGRLLPGQTTANLLQELKQVVDDPDLSLTVLDESAPIESPVDSPLYAQLASAVRELDPEGVAVPCLSPAAGPANVFCRLGMRFYGFAPVRPPDGTKASFAELSHAVDERLPLDGWKGGLRALYSAVRGFCVAG